MSEWLLLQDGMLIYVGLAMLLLGGAFGLPIPEDLPLLLAGILVQQQKIGLIPGLIVCYVAIVLGDIVIYWAGRTFGGALFKRRWFRKRGTRRRIIRMRQRLQERRFLMIFVARHLFYLRTVTFLTCGAVRVPFVDFLVSDLIAALVSVPLVIWLGHTFSENLDPIQKFLGNAQNLAIVLVVAAIAGYALYRWQQRQEAEPADETEDLDPVSEDADALLNGDDAVQKDLTEGDTNRHAKG